MCKQETGNKNQIARMLAANNETKQPTREKDSWQKARKVASKLKECMQLRKQVKNGTI